MSKKQKSYIIHVTRIEKYEADIQVKAGNKAEAIEKFEKAWDDGWLYEEMTDVINCDSQTYKARLAKPGELGDFNIDE